MVDMCQCGLFPVYAQQSRCDTSPALVLPAPLALCLDCIWQVSDQYERDLTDATVTVQRPWLNTRVPGLVGADGQL